jgi:hypothetical protein
MADFTPGGNPFLPRRRPMSAIDMLPGPTGPDRAALGAILREEETPSVFESLFRFLGRPSFVVRNLLTGNVEGAARNSLQFAQEFMNPIGALNPSLNLTAPFGVRDLSREKDRPEFSDVLRKWGVIKNRNALNGWEKFAIDVAGGVVTDPLTLVGGGGKIAGLVAKDIAVGTAAQTGMKAAEKIAKAGPALSQALDRKLATYLHVYTGRLARKASGERMGAMIRQEGSLRQAVGGLVGPAPDLEDALKTFHTVQSAPGPLGLGRNVQEVNKAFRGIRGEAAVDVILDTAREAGVDLRRGQGWVPGSFRGPMHRLDTQEGAAAFAQQHMPGVQVNLDDPLVQGWRQGRDIVHELDATFGQDPKKFFAVVPRGVPLPDVAGVTQGIQQGGIRRAPLNFVDEGLDVVYSRDNQVMANRVLENLRQAGDALSPFRRGVVAPPPPANFRPAAELHKALSGFRDLGYDDVFTHRLIRDQFGQAFPAEVDALLSSTDEVIRLGNTMPSSIPGPAIEALIKKGMAPGGGFSFSPLWSDTLGKWGERLTGWTYRSTFDPKTGRESAGYVFVPWGTLAKGTIPGMISSMAHEMNWKGPLFVEEQLGRGANWLVRNLYDKLHFGKHAFTNSETYSRAADAVEDAVRNLKLRYDAAVNRLPIAMREVAKGIGDGADGNEVAETITRIQHQKEQDFHTIQHSMWQEQRAGGVPSSLFERDTLIPALREMAREENLASPLSNIRTGARHARRMLDNIEQMDAAAAQGRADVAAADAALEAIQTQRNLDFPINQDVATYAHAADRARELQDIELGMVEEFTRSNPRLFENHRLAVLDEDIARARAGYIQPADLHRDPETLRGMIRENLDQPGRPGRIAASHLRGSNRYSGMRGEPASPVLRYFLDDMEYIDRNSGDWDNLHYPELINENDGTINQVPQAVMDHFYNVMNANALRNNAVISAAARRSRARIAIEERLNAYLPTNRPGNAELRDALTAPEVADLDGNPRPRSVDAWWDQVRPEITRAREAAYAESQAAYQRLVAAAERNGIPVAGGLPGRLREAYETIYNRNLRRQIAVEDWQNQARAQLGTIEEPFRAEFTRILDENAQRLVVGILSNELIDEVAAAHPNVPRQAIENLVRYGHEEMRKIATYMRYGAKNSGDLVHGAAHLTPAWPTIEQANPFYLPHQLDPRLVEALGRRDLTADQVTALTTVFDRKREYETIDEFIAAAMDIAEQKGIDASDVTELVQSDYRALILQRQLAFERTKFANEAHQAALRIAGTMGGPLGVYEDYLKGALSGVSPATRSPILKFMSGGPLSFETSQSYAKHIDFLNRSMDAPDSAPFIMERRVGNGYRLTINWPGLNALYKPLLTSSPPGMRFRFRNNVGSPFQLMFHPEVGFVGMKAFLDVLRNDGLVRWGIKQFGGAGSWKAPLAGGAKSLPDSAILAQMTEEQRVAWATQTFTRAITAPNEAERLLTRGALEQFHDLKIGPYTFKEAFGILDSVTGPRTTTRADLTDGIDDLQELLGIVNKPMHHDPNMMGLFVRKLRRFIDFGQEMANESETQWRVLGALKFMEMGKSPVEIVTEVNRLFVNYNRNSEIEGWVRGFIPFARFMIGSTGWFKDMIANPSGAGKGLIGRAASLQGLGTVSRSLTSPGDDGQGTPMVPSYVKETLALPLPWKDKEGNQAFLVSLGFPHEVAINMLSLVSGRPESLRRVALGSLQPVVKLPLEASLGQSFYFGTEFGSYRKAPWWTHGTIATEVPGPDGTTRYEVPGVLNEVLNAAPTAGMESTLNRLADDRRSIAGRLVNAMTGFQTQSVDQEAELQRRISDYLRAQVRSGTVGELKVFFERLRPEDVPEEVRAVLDQLEKIRAEKRRSKKEQR